MGFDGNGMMLEPCQGRGLDPFDGIEVVALGAASVKNDRK